MANELVTLTDGTNSVNFLSGEGATSGYVKRTIEGLDPPPLVVQSAGGMPISSSYDNREITITFGIAATDAADLTTKQTTLITILENTRLHWESKGGRGAKAQLQYRRPGGTNTSYIDVFWGECDWGRVEHQEGAAYAYSLKNAQLTLTCEVAFHPSAVVNLVTDQAVFNHDDAGHDNYFDIVAANIEGDIDAPCNIKVEPAADFGAADIAKVWIAMVGPKANIVHWGEIDMSYDSSRSNDSTYTTQSGVGTTYIYDVEQFAAIELNATEWAAMTGRTWHLFIGAYAQNTTIKWRARVTTRDWGVSNGIVLQTGKGVNHPEANQWCVVDLGPIYISHTMAGEYAGDKLWVGYERNAGGVNQQIMIDFLYLIPEHLYSVQVDKSASAFDNYVYNNVADNLYIKEAVDFPHHVFTESWTGPASIGCLGAHKRGLHPRLVPGQDNRVIFLFAESTDRHNITREFKVTIDYLPQYLTPME